jgi:rubrerythrin
MTTTITTYRAALEAIRDGSDAVCIQCGWMGSSQETIGLFVRICPNCDCNSIRFGPHGIAAYALKQEDN